jgi:hypothetical protein
MAVRPRPGQCNGCLGWGMLAQPPYCSPCHQWRSKKHNRPGACRRCHRAWLVNVDGLCGPCVAAVKESDAAWYFSPAPGPRPVQLELIIPGLALPPRQAFGNYRARSDGRFHPPRWARAQVAAALADDPRVCPPATAGQLALLRPQRMLVLEDEARIRDRPLAGEAAAESVLDAYATEHSYGEWWRHAVRAALRLALAIRDADGKLLVDDEALSGLPRFAGAAAEIFRRAALLDPRCQRAPGPRGPRTRVAPGPRSCESCGSWGTCRKCEGCQSWEAYGGHQPGTCGRCGQPCVPLKEGRCRACLVHVREHGPLTAAQPWVQLWIALPDASTPRNALRAPGRPPPMAPEPSPHLVDPGQAILFAAQRDWLPVLAARSLPALTNSGQLLLDEFQLARPEGGRPDSWHASARALRVLVSWLGADAPFHEADVRALGGLAATVKPRRALAFLAGRGLLIPDPSRQSEPREHAVARMIAQFPRPIARELSTWVMVARGQGRARHPARMFKTIRNYLSVMMPSLMDWSARYGSLREVTRNDILDAVAARHGPVTRRRIVALRSLFRALRQERVVFRDPTRGISLPSLDRLPQPLLSDQVAGLLQRAGTEAARLAVALVAIHAATTASLAKVKLADLDLASARLTVKNRREQRVIYLDDVTLEVLSRWLRYRHQRWPVSPNPYLFVTQQTAVGTDPVSSTWFWILFEPLGIHPGSLRQDRILDEARHTADPVHLIRVFGISDTTALKYVHAAHPGRQSVIPR